MGGQSPPDLIRRAEIVVRIADPASSISTPGSRFPEGVTLARLTLSCFCSYMRVRQTHCRDGVGHVTSLVFVGFGYILMCHCIHGECRRVLLVSPQDSGCCGDRCCRSKSSARSEEHTSELQSLMRLSYAVFFL